MSAQNPADLLPMADVFSYSKKDHHLSSTTIGYVNEQDQLHSIQTNLFFPPVIFEQQKFVAIWEKYLGTYLSK